MLPWQNPCARAGLPIQAPPRKEDVRRSSGMAIQCRQSGGRYSRLPHQVRKNSRLNNPLIASRTAAPESPSFSFSFSCHLALLHYPALGRRYA